MGEVTDSVVVLDGFGDEGVDEEGDFLIRWWHFDFFLSLSLRLFWRDWGGKLRLEWVGCADHGGARRR